MTNNTTNAADRIAELDQALAREYRNRLNTNGHGRRAVIQERIDALEIELASLHPEIGILQRNRGLVFYLCSPTGKIREFPSLAKCREELPRNRAAADRTPRAYDVHRSRLELEGFRLGSDADGFDVYRHQDGRALAWINVQRGGVDKFTVKRAGELEAKADRISCLVRRRRSLLVEIARADKARTEEIHAELETTAAELERLSAPAAELEPAA